KPLEAAVAEADDRRADGFPIPEMQAHDDDRLAGSPRREKMLAAGDRDAPLLPQAVEHREFEHDPADMVEEPHHRSLGIARGRAVPREPQIGPLCPLARGMKSMAAVEDAEPAAD